MNTTRAFPLVVLLFAVLILMVHAQPASAHGWHGQCVQWVKAIKPQYRSVNGGRWIYARELWDFVAPRNKGRVATVGSVLVLDRFGSNAAGHVAIVKRVDGNRIFVEHANWNVSNHVTSGWFTLVNGTGAKWDGWRSVYPVRGFVYRP